jgi:predicted dehydrogenase
MTASFKLASFRLAVFGCGEKDWELRIPAAQALGVEVIAVADPDLSRAKLVARALGVSAAFGSLEEMIAREELDGVVVMSPAEAQCAATVYALQHGLHVLCEAPFGRSAAEAEQMIEAAELVNRVLASGYHYPLQASWPLSYASLGGIGARYRLEGNWLSSVSASDRSIPDRPGSRSNPGIRDVVADLGIHHLLSVGLPMLGSRPVAVTAQGRWSRLDRDASPLRIEDGFSMTVEFASGARGSFMAARGVDALSERFDVCCYGNEGQVQAWLMPAGLDPEAFRPSVIGRVGNVRWGVAPMSIEETFVIQQWSWIAACRGGQVLGLGPQDAVLVHKVLDAAYESVKRGGERIEI